MYQNVTAHFQASKIPVTCLFEIFSIDFEGTFELSRKGKQFHYHRLRSHNWLADRLGSAKATSKNLIIFNKDKFILPFRSQNMIKLDIATVFKAAFLEGFVNG